MNEVGSLEKDDYLPKAKHNKMPRNIFAQDEPVVLQPFIPKLVETPKNNVVNNNFV